METRRYQLLEIFIKDVWSWDDTHRVRYLAPNHPYSVYYNEILEHKTDNGKARYLNDKGCPEFASRELAEDFMNAKINKSEKLINLISNTH